MRGGVSDTCLAPSLLPSWGTPAAQSCEPQLPSWTHSSGGRGRGIDRTTPVARCRMRFGSPAVGSRKASHKQGFLPKDGCPFTFLSLQQGQRRGKGEGEGARLLMRHFPQLWHQAVSPQGAGCSPSCRRCAHLTCHCGSAEPGARSPMQLSGGRNRVPQRAADPEKLCGAGDFSSASFCTGSLHSREGHPIPDIYRAPPPPRPLRG